MNNSLKRNIFFGILLFCLFLFVKQASANYICAYLANDGKYACVGGSENYAGSDGKVHTCPRKAECSGKDCLPIDSSRCGSSLGMSTHYACVNLSCARVLGEGSNLCVDSTDCDPRYASLCAYVAADGKYACVGGTEYEASLTSGRTTCSNINRSECKTNSCNSIKKYLCGMEAPKNPPPASTSIPPTDPRTPGTPGGAGEGDKTPPAGIDCNVPGNCLYNPIPADGLIDLFLIVVKGFLAIMGVLAVCFIIVGGFSMVVSAGNEEAVGKAKKMITWAVLGMVVALLSFSMVAIVQSLLQTDVKDFPSGTGMKVKSPEGVPSGYEVLTSN